MNSKGLIGKALSMCLVVAVVATYSMVVMAGPVKDSGVLYVTGKGLSGVTVNGEAAANGRSIFSGSTISTPADADATINLGDAGTIRLAPSSSLAVSFDSGKISGSLLSGEVSVVNSLNPVKVSLEGGKVVDLNAGESASAAARAQDDGNGGGSAWIIWALVFGGAAAGIILAATTNNNDLQLGGGTTVVSPNR